MNKKRLFRYTAALILLTLLIPWSGSHAPATLSQTLQGQIFNDVKTVTTAGTRVQISTTSRPVTGVIIRALSTNTGTIYVGNATVASSNGFPLLMGEAISIPINNLNKVYIDSSVNGEGVRYIAVAY